MDVSQVITVTDPAVAIDAQLVTGGYRPDIARGRPELAFARVRESWLPFRGRAVEPLIRTSLERVADSDPVLAGVGVIGGHWTRTNDVEVDLVGADRWPDARRITVTGSVKWRDQAPVDRRDLAALAEHRARVPGATDAALIAVSRAGCTARDVDRAYGPADIVAAWR
jgi:uncharacterized protein